MGNLWSNSGESNEATEYREGTRTRQYVTLKSQFDKLVTCVEGSVGEVARKAFANNLVNRSTLEAASNQHHGTQERATNLLLVILGKIEERADHFDTFTEILREIPTCKDKGDELVRLLDGAAQQETQQGR